MEGLEYEWYQSINQQTKYTPEYRFCGKDTQEMFLRNPQFEN